MQNDVGGEAEVMERNFLKYNEKGQVKEHE